MRTIKRETRTKKKIQGDFLKHLETTGNVTIAAKKAKVPRRTVYDWLAKDAVFKAVFEVSAKIGVELLEDEAQRRAFHGTLKPVFQGGKLVGTVKEYSDALLIFLLKGKKPEIYKERMEHSGQIDGTTTFKIGYGQREDTES